MNQTTPSVIKSLRKRNIRQETCILPLSAGSAGSTFLFSTLDFHKEAINSWRLANKYESRF